MNTSAPAEPSMTRTQALLKMGFFQVVDILFIVLFVAAGA